jgi:mannose-1-phosphate guanylyltransferase
MKEHYYGVIMAGGIGSRFWPVSTAEFPKQFHDMLGTGHSLLQSTYRRLTKFIDPAQVLILTNDRYRELVCEQLPGCRDQQLVLEPAMRNTAPCILLSALKIAKMDPEGVMLVAPSDHWIENEDAFRADVENAFKRCSEQEVLMTLGIVPTFPNTGYGYIEYDKADSSLVKPVKQFREKPDYETAREFIDAGNFLWNAGIFIWKASTVVAAFKRHLPQMYNLFASGAEHLNNESEFSFVKEHYHLAENVSVDYGIMEKADNVMVQPASFDWNDLGTWGALHDKLDKDYKGNTVVRAITHLRDSSGNTVFTEKTKLVVVDGLDDYVIVDKDDVLFIYPRDKDQDIKSLLKELTDRFGNQYS